MESENKDKHGVLNLLNKENKHSNNELHEFSIYIYSQERNMYISLKAFKKYYSDYFKNKSDSSSTKQIIIELYKHDYIFIGKKEKSNHFFDHFSECTNNDIVIKFNELYSGKQYIFLNLLKNDIFDYLLDNVKQLNKNTKKLQKQNQMITEKIYNYNKDILTIMALFVSIVALLTANVSAISNLTAIGIITMNISLLISILIIFLLINNTIGKESSKLTNNIISIISIIILAIILLLLVFKSNLDSTLPNNEKESINNNYDQSFKLDIKGETETFQKPIINGN